MNKEGFSAKKGTTICGNLIETLLTPSAGFSPFPFWFLNDAPDERRIRAQLEDYVQKGVNGFVLHPRIGIPEEITYLSEAYFETVCYIVKTAAELEMKVVLYDEGMYPSGSACGMVVAANPDFAAKGITIRKTAEEGEVLAELSGGRYLVKDFTRGTIRGIHFGEDDGEAGAPAAADILNPEAVQLFIRLTHERYYENLEEYFGNTIIAFFTDEPCALGRNAVTFREWADGMEKEIEVLGGKLEELEGLFDGRKNRTTNIYHNLVKKYLRENFYRPISTWCKAHGIALMGHPAESDDVTEELYFQIPGQDLILRRVEPKTGGLQEFDSVQAKLTADIARHIGCLRNMNECFGVCVRNGIPWYFTGEDMKWYIDWLGIRGVNFFVPHAFYYSVRGKRSGERPPDVGPNNIWWEHYRYFSDYMKRLSCLMTDSINYAKIAVLCDDNHVPYKEIAYLYENQIEFNYLPVQVLSACYVENGALCIQEYQYDVVLDLIGKTDRKDKDCMLWNQVPVAHGVQELLTGRMEECSLRTVEPVGKNGDVLFCPSLRATHFKRMGVECYLFSNEGQEPIDIMFRIKGAKRNDAVWMDLWNGFFGRAINKLKDDTMSEELFPLVLRPCETRLLLIDSLQTVTQILPEEHFLGDWTDYFHLIEKGDNRAVYEYCYESAFTDINASFSVRGEEMAECWCNGIFAGVSFWNEHRFGIGKWLKKGNNKIRLVLTGNAANLYANADIFYGLRQRK